MIKLIKVDDEEWKKEATILSGLNHENIVKYCDHFQLITKESLCHPCIITEYCQVSKFSLIQYRIESTNIGILEWRLVKTNKRNKTSKRDISR